VLLGAAETDALLRGIPQQGAALGSPRAPVTLVEYADLQCPYCARWSHEVFPAVVRDHVRKGHVRIEFRGLAFVGPDSEPAVRAVLAAGEQGKLWNAVHLLYSNQGPENSGWVTEDLLAALGPSIRGLDAQRMLDASDGSAVDAALAEAWNSGVRSTPTLDLGPTGGTLERLGSDALSSDSLGRRINALVPRA
jgi:protein-disulfide isomerase